MAVRPTDCPWTSCPGPGRARASLRPLLQVVTPRFAELRTNPGLLAPPIHAGPLRDGSPWGRGRGRPLHSGLQPPLEVTWTGQGYCWPRLELGSPRPQRPFPLWPCPGLGTSGPPDWAGLGVLCPAKRMSCPPPPPSTFLQELPWASWGGGGV